MEKISTDDPRQLREKVASSIRAAILSGEFRPGQQLPAGDSLMEFFDVSRKTMNTAIRILEGEGFVWTRPGVGVFVQDGVPSGQPTEAHPFGGVAAFLHEAGQLKLTPRTGWLRLGIRHPESVAEHTYRVCVVGAVLAAIAGADPAATVLHCLVHDFHEIRAGDQDAVSRSATITSPPETVTVAQTANLPAAVADLWRESVRGFEAKDTPEAKLAGDADKIELILQAAEYEREGYDTSGWTRNALLSLRTPEGKELGEAITAGDPLAWMDPFNASYVDLRRAARGAAARVGEHVPPRSQEDQEATD